MIEIVRHFFCGAAVGSTLAFFFARIHNSMTFKKENEFTVDQIFKWIIIGFIIGGSIGAAILKGNCT